MINYNASQYKYKGFIIIQYIVGSHSVSHYHNHNHGITMIVELFTFMMLLDPTRAWEKETPGPVRVCDKIYPPANQSLLNINCILQATVYQIKTKILSEKVEEQLSLFEILRGKNVTWAEAINSLSAELKDLLDLRRKREVISIETCSDFRRQLDILVTQLQNGTQTKAYQVSSLRSILLHLNSKLDDVQCKAQEKEFIASQMMKLDLELTSFNEYLTNLTFSTTTTTTTTTSSTTTTTSSTTTTSVANSNSNWTWLEADTGRYLNQENPT